jgi:hypothetical protein
LSASVLLVLQQGQGLPVPWVRLLVPLLAQLVVAVRTGTAGQQSWIQQKAMPAVVRTALVEGRIEVAQSLLAEAGSTALAQVPRMWLQEQRTSLALAAHTPWSGAPHTSLQAARTSQAAGLRMSLQAARTSQAAGLRMSLQAARTSQAEELRTSQELAHKQLAECT